MTNEQHIENLKKLKSFHNGSYGADIDRAIKALEQEPKTGHWRHYEGMLICSECGTEFYDDIMEYCGDDVPKYCPNCGCCMVEPQERSDKE